MTFQTVEQLQAQIASLTAENEQLRQALKPFADCVVHLHPLHDPEAETLDGIKVREWRAAYAALQPKEGGVMGGAHLIHETPELEHCKKAMLFHSDRADAVTVQNERLMRALKNILLEFDFMVENDLIADTRGDIIFVEARAALQPKEGDQ